MYKRFHALIGLWMIGVAMLASGCGNESAERQAFIDFLQKHIIEKESSGIPIPNDKLRGSFGRYAEHYDIIVGFHRTVGEKLEPMGDMMKGMSGLQLNKLGLDESKAIFTKINDGMKQLAQVTDEELANAEKKFAQVKQPDDLKIVYTQAFDKKVRSMAAATRPLPSLFDALTKDFFEWADFILSNPDKFDAKTSTILTRDKAFIQQFNVHSRKVNTSLARLNDTYRRMLSQ
ncbi:MAG: DUF3053 domain-containing protein [Zoogloeaceae bacterium]|jgi:hypothetical protein|nr:DUF3053 domain-containing protein [Zoogloeaceae bacterium]